MNNKISLAGDLGSGKSTVSAILKQMLGYETYSTGALVREIAKKHGMSVVELNVYMETHPEIDHEIDDGLRQLANDPRGLIIDSRMAWHFTAGTFKVYLTADVETASLRIMNSHRDGEHAATLEETIRNTKNRRSSENKRYFEQYGVHITDMSNYDLILDTTYATPEEIANTLVSEYEAWKNDPDYQRVMISPERLLYPDDAPDGETVASLSSILEEGAPIPTVVVSERDGEYYVKDGVESALAYAFNMNTFVPAVLFPFEEDGKCYVRMKNSL